MPAYAAAEPVRTREPASLRPNRTGIPNGVKNQFERLSGFSFDDVRVRYQSGRPAALHALAYTQGEQVYLGPGQERHLGHELAHVVQQKQGRVPPRAYVGGLAVNDDPALEREADRLSSQAAAMPPSEAPVSKAAGASSQSVQRQKIQFADDDVADSLNFQPGDLLYGLTPDRRAYAPMMDRINAFYQGQLHSQGGQMQGMALNEPVIVDYMNNAFVGTAQNASFGDVKAMNPDVTGSQTYKKYRQAFQLLMDGKMSKISGPDNIGDRIRAACKFGIWFTVKTGHTVRFVLDTIYNSQAQRAIAHRTGTHGDAVTSTELRYVRTAWDEFKGAVRFYNRQATVGAPWEVNFINEWEGSVKETLDMDRPFLAEYIVNPEKLNDEADAIKKHGEEVMEKIEVFDNEILRLIEVRTRRFMNRTAIAKLKDSEMDDLLQEDQGDQDRIEELKERKRVLIDELGLVVEELEARVRARMEVERLWAAYRAQQGGPGPVGVPASIGG